MSCGLLPRSATELQIVGTQASPFRDTRQHSGTDFLPVVKCKDVIGPIGTHQNTVRAGLPLEGPSDAVKRS